MDVNIAVKDGDQARPSLSDAPSIVELPNTIIDGSGKKKRRRGKSKRKIMKPFMKAPWQDRRKNDKTKRINRFRKIVMANTHAPFNNNQFLMEIHKPEPENSFNRTPARTRDSSFSVDSEDNYFFSLPEDEEEYLTKEFSSVYEDAQSERLSNMSKAELIQEYLLLEAKYDNLMKRTERSKPRLKEEEIDIATERDTSATSIDRDSMITDRDTSATSNDSSTAGDTSVDIIMRHVKEQETQIRELQLTNEKLRLENEALQQRIRNSSSEDSESDSSSTTSGSSSSSSNTDGSMTPVSPKVAEVDNEVPEETLNGLNGEIEGNESTYPVVNGFHNPDD